MATAVVGGRIVEHSRGRETRVFLRQRQQRIAFSATQTPASVLAEEEDHESENQTEADGESERYDGHGTGPFLVGAGMAERGCRDLRRTPASLGIAAMAMAEHLFRGQPVVEVAPLRAALFGPKQISGVLDFRFGRFTWNRFGISFHGRFFLDGVSLRQWA